MTGRTVLVLPAWYPTAWEPLSGPFVRDHCRAAAAYGHQLVVLVDEGPRPDVRGLFELRTARDGELTVVRLAGRRRWGRVTPLFAVLLLARRLAREGRPIDVIHAHVHRMAWLAVLAGVLLRRPVVISEHSSAWPRRRLSDNQLWRARIAFRRAALVCPVNEGLRASIESYGVEARFRVVPNAVDTQVFHPRSTLMSAAPARLINVALHVEVKSLDVLLHAFAGLRARRPMLRLEMLGEGPLTQDLRRLAAELGITECVSFRGRTTPAEVADALRRSDLFVMSSVSENLPLAVLEALCCGLPVVATDVGGIPEAVGEDGRLARPGDVEGLAAAIEDVLRNYLRFDTKDIAGRAAARYSFDAVGRLWDVIYRDLTSAPSG